MIHRYDELTITVESTTLEEIFSAACAAAAAAAFSSDRFCQTFVGGGGAGSLNSTAFGFSLSSSARPDLLDSSAVSAESGCCLLRKGE